MAKKEYERRKLDINVRDIKEDGTFSGYGSVFGVVDSYGTVVDAGAFTETLKNRKTPVRLLWQHESGEPIGIFTELYEDAHGLRFTGQLNLDPATLGPKAYALLKQGALDGMSIGFWVIRESYDHTTKLTHFTEVKLREISVVTFPANEDATINEVRSAFDELTTEQRVETIHFINKFRTSPASVEAPAAGEVATLPTDHPTTEHADEKSTETPDEDIELRHLLETLSSAIRSTTEVVRAR